MKGLFNTYISNLETLNSALDEVAALDSLVDKKYLYQSIASMNNQMFYANEYLKGLPFDSFERLTIGSTLTELTGFTVGSEYIEDSEGNAVNVLGGYSVNGDGYIIQVSEQVLSTEPLYSLDEENNILNDRSEKVNVDSGYSVDEQGYVIYGEEAITAQGSFYIEEEGVLFDEEGREFSRLLEVILLIPKDI